MPVKVNGREITPQEIEQEMERLRPSYVTMFKDQPKEEQEKQLREWSTENVIERMLLQQYARDEIQNVPVEAVDKAFNELVERHGDEAKFFEATQTKPEDKEKIKAELEDQIRVEQAVQQIMRQAQRPGTASARKFYQENKQQFINPEQVRAAHIVKHVNAETDDKTAHEQILAVKKELDSGKPFEELADEHSDCPGNGGDLGYFPRGQMVQSFEDVVFNTKPGDITDIIKSEFGYHIAKVYEKRPVTAVHFDKVKDRIVEHLWEERRTKKLEEFLDHLKEKSDVQRNSD
jgi:parvulin-like peptidyl-prolyl isomerase